MNQIAKAYEAAIAAHKLTDRLIEVERLRAQNERLTEAAPDLLAACEDAYGFLEYIYSHDENHRDAKPFLDKLEAAIAKAKGES